MLIFICKRSNSLKKRAVKVIKAFQERFQQRRIRFELEFEHIGYFG